MRGDNATHSDPKNRPLSVSHFSKIKSIGKVEGDHATQPFSEATQEMMPESARQGKHTWRTPARDLRYTWGRRYIEINQPRGQNVERCCGQVTLPH